MGFAIARLLAAAMVAASVASAVLPVSAISPASAKDKTVGVPRDDPEMVKAIQTARSTLPIFWETYERRPAKETDFSLKVKMTDGRSVEHFWMSDITRLDGKVFGVVSNDPNSVMTLSKGQRVEIAESDITDWLFYRNGKMVGNRTLRAMFRFMSREDVRRFKEILADP